VVRAAVDEDGCVTTDGSELFKSGRDDTGSAMRQGQDDDVMLCEGLRLGRPDDSVGQRQQVRMVITKTTTGGRGGCERTDPYLGMVDK
jgi:hypothetical protein